MQFSKLSLVLGLFLSSLSGLSVDKPTAYALPPATKGNEYTAQIAFQVQGVFPFTVSIGKGSLPDGITISASGLLSGKPTDNNTEEKDYEFTATVTDARKQSQSFEFKLHLYTSPQLVVVGTAAPGAAGSGTSAGSENNCTKNQPLPVTYALQEGSTQISGKAAQPGTGCTAILNVYSVKQSSAPDPTDASKIVNSVQKQMLPLTSGNSPTDGKFDLQLQSPLQAGQKIQVEEVITDSSTKLAGPPLLSTVSEVAGLGDWGRVKAYFTSGILISQDQSSFSQSSLFLSFSLDKSWRLPGYYYGRKTGKSVVPRLGWPPGVNSFFETRLTSIPVTAQSCQSGGTGTTATQCPAGTQLNTFLSSRKTARLQVGAYLPFTLTGWQFKGTTNTLFLAPIAKVGFDTPTSPVNQQQLQSQSPVPAGGSTSQATLVNDTNFYNFYAFGGRFGHYAMTNSKDEAPELISYLDFTAGRFSNLESVLADGSRKRLYRLSIEGILKVPNTPLIVGVSANIGQSSAGVGTLAIKQKAGDDLRFLFGTKFDVGKLLGEIKKSSF